MKIELLAPAGNFSKLKTAIYYGADAVYLGGKNFSLRAFSDNFTEKELLLAVKYVHERGKKIYITVNIFAKNSDFIKAEEYFKYLEKINDLIYHKIIRIREEKRNARFQSGNS